MSFLTDHALEKISLLYLMQIIKKWIQPTQNWGLILNQFLTIFLWSSILKKLNLVELFFTLYIESLLIKCLITLLPLLRFLSFYHCLPLYISYLEH